MRTGDQRAVPRDRRRRSGPAASHVKGHDDDSRVFVSHAHLRRAARRAMSGSAWCCSAGCTACATSAASLFFDVRDRHGLTQVVIRERNNPKFAWRQVAARVRRRGRRARSSRGRPRRSTPRSRPARSRSSPSRFEILNEARTPPFPINEDAPVAEETRLRYRYLDLRAAGAAAEPGRCGTAWRWRRGSTSTTQGFLEIETPILTRSTPEGARDYLVPSRVHPGEFFALPQSPQIFKQILMIAGMDRYFQIVRCFRDEDLRADRQPEFTQIDVEMSFATEELVYGVVEGAIQAMFGAVGRHGRRRRSRALRSTRRWRSTDRTSPICGPACRSPTSARASRIRRSACSATRSPSGGVGARLRRAAAAPNSRARSSTISTEQARQLGASGSSGSASADGALQSSALKVAGEAPLRAAFEDAGGRRGDLLLFDGAGRRQRWPTCSASCACTSRKRENLLRPDDFRSSGSPSFRCSNGNRTRSAGTRCTIRSRRRATRTWRCSRPTRQRVRARAYDLALNGSEIAGGSIRIHRADVQRQVFRLLGISDEEAKARFGFFLDALEYGTPPHGGIAFGLDRIVALLCGEVVDPRSHRVPEDRAGRGPDGRRAVDRRRAAAARAAHQVDRHA